MIFLATEIFISIILFVASSVIIQAHVRTSIPKILYIAAIVGAAYSLVRFVEIFLTKDKIRRWSTFVSQFTVGYLFFLCVLALAVSNDKPILGVSGTALIINLPIWMVCAYFLYTTSRPPQTPVENYLYDIMVFGYVVLIVPIALVIRYLFEQYDGTVQQSTSAPMFFGALGIFGSWVFMILLLFFTNYFRFWFLYVHAIIVFCFSVYTVTIQRNTGMQTAVGIQIAINIIIALVIVYNWIVTKTKKK